MKSVHICQTVGPCPERQLDTQKIKAFLLKNNYLLVKKPRQADYIVLITCAFNEACEDLSIDAVCRLNEYSGTLIVIGCLPAINEERLRKHFKGTVVPTRNIDELDKILKQDVSFGDIPDANAYWQDVSGARSLPLQGVIKTFFRKFRFNRRFLKMAVSHLVNDISGKRSKSYVVRVAWGCSGSCSYCCIKKAIGPLKSKSLADCLAEIKGGIQQKYASFTLLADDLGAYGNDFPNYVNYIALLREVIKLPKCENICIGGIDPKWIIRYWDDLDKILQSGKIKFITSSIQSGSDRILRLMRRDYEVEEIKISLNY
jgi:tRNA A37 methylthiotransferase MiaB